ncbi:hypothetical protein [Xenorhabdus griffiniae]|uniref:hypothetical protein n=1 Tax=Xenorhabdus griffiniae TaxID=351672 RepID=UPI00235917B6|nr:hypothetical protein [Xenorhabdus griffiniae]MDC9605459.1 hypothetical protein [Xenorhabdus griffiniae]
MVQSQGERSDIIAFFLFGILYRRYVVIVQLIAKPVFAKSCLQPLWYTNAGTVAEPAANFGQLQVYLPTPASQPTTSATQKKNTPPLISEQEKLYLAALVASSTRENQAQIIWGALKRAFGDDKETTQHNLERLKQLADQKSGRDHWR